METQQNGKIQYGSIRETKWRVNIDGTITVTNTIMGTGIVPIKNFKSKAREDNSRRQDKTEDNMLHSAMHRETPVIYVYLAYHC